MFLWKQFTILFNSLNQKFWFLFSIFDYHFDSLVAKIQNISWIASSEFFDIVTKGSVIIAIKLLMFIALLILIRGGLPRYRFDHLTKIGWVKFLTVIICFFLSELLFIYTLLS